MGKIDMTGQRFGRLVVLHEDGRNKYGSVLWRCRCVCCNEVTVRGVDLRNGNTTSCGCYNHERSVECNTTHGMSSSRLYSVWRKMLVRTGIHKGANEKTKRNYQDRGITVCEEWRTFENFRDWALTHGYSDHLEIDRIDNDRGYMPENCRWVTDKENVNNRRNTVRFEDGTSLAMFCSEVGIPTVQENGKTSNQYKRILYAYSKHHKAHPELIQKANETIGIYRQCIELVRLLDEVKQLRRNLTK